MIETIPIRPLRSEADHEAALAGYERCFDREPKPGTPEGDRFELLGLVIAKYEDEHFPIDAPEPMDTIRLDMESRGLSQKDLAEVLGFPSRTSEILKGRRELSVKHIRRLHRQWGIPAEALLGRAVETV